MMKTLEQNDISKQLISTPPILKSVW